MKKFCINRSLSSSMEIIEHGGISWIDTDRELVSSKEPEILIDEKFNCIGEIDGLKTNLFRHQQPIVKAMVDLEINRVVPVLGKLISFDLTANAGILSEAVGSGKTIDILSLIIIQKKNALNTNLQKTQDISHMHTVDNKYCSLKYGGIIRKSYVNNLTPTIIFVGVSVVDQWSDAITRFTSLSVYIVGEVRSLQKLINMMHNNEVNNYDIILVKNGKISRPIKFPDGLLVESKNICKTSLYIYNVINNMRTCNWARVVIDDFDTIGLPYNSGIINSSFTWYISSTKKIMPIKSAPNTQFTTTADALMHGSYNCCSISRNNSLFSKLNIRNSTTFINEVSSIGSPKFFAYKFKNYDNKIIGLLGSMNNNEVNEIVEMLNSDAIETAAGKLGIKLTNVADIFEHILGTQYSTYKTAITVLEYIANAELLQGKRLPMSKNPNPNDTFKKSDILNNREILYNYPNLPGILEDTKQEHTQNLKTAGIAIERVKSNVTIGGCPVCEGDLCDDDLIIFKCCGVILCGMCCFSAVFKDKNTTGVCSNCRCNTTISNLIYLNSEFDLTKIVENKLDHKQEDCDEKIDKYIERTKIMAIIDIIKGVKPIEQKHVNVNISNLLHGSCELTSINYNKVLIFANYDETIKIIKTALDSENLQYWQLKGTHKEITATVKLFTNCTKTCSLIINSTTHCAGLNLQTATDLIFAHKIIDTNVETQVIGRGQRIGRTSPLNVHYMLYDNEYSTMLLNGTIREID